MRILITGASGLLGGALVQLAIALNHDVQALYLEHPLHGVLAQRLDITDRAAVEKTLAEKSAEVVIHTASITDLDLCERDPDLAFRVNANATRFVAKASKKVKSHLIYVSTDYVFDGQKGSYAEDDRANPINVYGKSKLAGEQEVIQEAGDFCIARTSVVFGWGREHRPNFATWVYNRLRTDQRINVVTDQYATPTLNTNLARMLLEAAERRMKGTIHLSGSTRINRYEFATLIARKFDFDEKLLTPVRSGAVHWVAKRPFDSSLNTEKARKHLENKPISINDALNAFAARD